MRIALKVLLDLTRGVEEEGSVGLSPFVGIMRDFGRLRPPSLIEHHLDWISS